MTRRRLIATIACLALVLPAFAAEGQASRDAALRALALRLDLPLVDETVATFATQLRRTIPAAVVDAAGRNAGLGSGWAKGNPVFDDAVRRLDAALAADEVRAGPLVRIERADLLDAVDLPWTLDDIAFVGETLPTPLGREAERALDAKAAQQMIATLKRRVPAVGDGLATRATFAGIDERANAKFGDALLMLLPLKGADPTRAVRLQRLVESVKVAPSDALGQRLVDRISRRLVDAALAQVPALLNGLR
jgi:hypothetical protein